MTSPIDLKPEAYEREPFPSGVLPDPLKTFVRRAAAALGCDQSFIALPMLSVLASCVGSTRRIRLKRTWAEPCIIWSVIVAESGSMKSPALRAALAPLQALQRKAFAQHAEEMRVYKSSELPGYEAALAEWKSKGRRQGEDAPEEPVAPTARRYLVSDATVEAMVPLLMENPRGLLYARDEFAGFLASFDAYRNGRGGDSAKWIEMFHAQEVAIDRKTGPTLYVPRAAVSLTGTIQPAILQAALGREHFENGLAARLLMTMPPRELKEWRDADLDEETDESMMRVIQGLLNLQHQEVDDGQLRAIDLHLTPKGKKAWIDHYNRHNREQLEYTGNMAAAWSKLEGYTARLALLFHLIRQAAGDRRLADPRAVDEQSLACAMQLVRWFGAETERIYAGLRRSDEQRRFDQVMELIRARGGKITVRDLQRARRAYSDGSVALDELQAMAGAGFGTLEYPQPGQKGGRPGSAVFTLAQEYAVDKTSAQMALAG